MNSGSPADRPYRPQVPLKAVLSVRPVAGLSRSQRARVRQASGLSRWQVRTLRASARRELWWRGDDRLALAVLDRDPDRHHPPTQWRLTLLAADVPENLDAVVEAVVAAADRDDRVLLVDLGERPPLVDPSHYSRLTAYGFVRSSAHGLTRVPR